MRILHYALGFPPYRSGGLTKFCCDLMEEQCKRGNDVALLWPGRFGFLSRKPQIMQRKTKNKIYNYELVNPLPVPLDEGVIDPSPYMQSCDKNIFTYFFRKWKPKIIHVHTLMGIYKEFFDEAARLGIKVVFTTHDYFGLCPMTTFYNQEGLCNYNDCDYCVDCNSNALSIRKIKLLQSQIYRLFKNTSAVKLLRKKHKELIQGERNRDLVSPTLKKKDGSQYEKLRNYYLAMLELVTVIHYNSSQTRDMYEKFISSQKGKVISITHKNIKNNKKIRSYNNEKIRLLYLSPAKRAKGFFWLKHQLNILWEEGYRNFTLDTYCSYDGQESYIKNHPGYNYSDLENIFDEVDLLLIPSLWNETFGFTLLEALAYGVPVLASDRVGARDLIKEYGRVFLIQEEEEFRYLIRTLNGKMLEKWNENIYHYFKVKDYSEFVDEIMRLYN